MSKQMQPTLFEQAGEVQSPLVAQDITNIPARIAAVADKKGPVEHADRTSEAARDQGWGPVDLSVETATALEDMTEVVPRSQANRSQARRTRTFSSRSGRRGDSERDAGITPVGHETAEKLTDVQVAVGKLGVYIGHDKLKPSSKK